MKTTIKHCISLALEPQGVFIGTREGGTVWSRAQNLGARLHRIAAKTRHLPRFRGSTGAARAAPPASRFPNVRLSDVLASF